MSIKTILKEQFSEYKDVENHFMLPNKRHKELGNRIKNFWKGSNSHGYVKLGEGGGIWVIIHDIKNNEVFGKVAKIPSFHRVAYLKEGELVKFDKKYLVMVEQTNPTK